MTLAIRERENLRIEIAEKQAELDKLDANAKALDEMEPDQALAIVLHDIMCTANHTDGCSWHYETLDWSRDAHKRWLKKAKNVLQYINDNNLGLSRDELAYLLTMIKAY